MQALTSNIAVISSCTVGSRPVARASRVAKMSAARVAAPVRGAFYGDVSALRCRSDDLILIEIAFR